MDDEVVGTGPVPPLVLGGHTTERHFGDPDEVERGEEGAFGEEVPCVGEPVQLRPPAAGLPGLLVPDPPQPPCCSSRMRRSLRLLSRITLGDAPDDGDGPLPPAAHPLAPPRTATGGDEAAESSLSRGS